MRINYAQTAFTGGEWSPRLNGQVDQKKYYTASAQLENLLIQTHGPITRRPGTKFIAESKDHTKKITLIPFEFSSVQAYMLEFGEYYIRFFKDRGQIGETSVLLDLMEYANDAAAQAAFVSSGADLYTKLLLHGDGSGQTIVDETGKTVSVYGNTTQSATQSKFGGKSIYFDGTGDYLTTPDHADWDFGSGDFTIDMWVRFDSAPGDAAFYSQYQNDSNYCYLMRLSGVVWFRFVTGLSHRANYHFTWTPVVDTWYHLALVRNGSTCYIFVNGVSVSLTVDTAFNGNLSGISSDLYIGTYGGGGYLFKGYMDEYRVSNGIARWTANFTPPTVAYSLAPTLQDYSEATIKQEGSYSLKGIAQITTSLNKTLTRVVSPVIDLTGKTFIEFDIRVSRTGSNIKIGIHDSGGTTTEITPNILAADTWQTVVWDISAIPNADKNTIDNIIITIVNADAANTFYIDNMLGDQDIPIPYEIVSPYIAADVETLWFIQSADTMYLVHPLYAPRKLTRTGHAAWALNEIDFIDGPYLTENITGITLQPSGTTGNITLTAVPVIGAEKVDNGAFAAAGTWVYGAGWAFDGANFEADHTAGAGNVAPLEQNIAAVAAKNYLVVFTIKNRTVGSIVPSVGGVNGPTRGANGTYSQTILTTTTGNLKFTPTADFDGSIDDVSVKETSGTTDIFQTGHIGSLWRIKQGATWGYVKIATVTDNLHATATVKTTLGGTAAVTTWREGAWSGVRGYPTCCAFHEERLVFAGTTNQPQTIWGSKSGDFENFTPETTITDAGPFTYTMASDQINTIRWLCSSRLLMAGTLSGEWKIAASSLTAPITPTDISVRKDTSYGSANVRPQPVGNVVLFVQRQGRKVRELAYSYADDSYVAPDMSLISEHITAGGITRIAYQREPDQTLWCIRGDGVLLSMVYERPQEVVGWSKHTTDGFWESVATIPGLTQDEVWLVAKRTIGGSTKRYVELMQPVDWGADQEDCFFVDSGLVYDGAPITTITGLGHLTGKTVAILADGAVVPNQTVIDGKIILTTAASVVHAGLSFTPKFKNLPPEVPTQTGTSQGLNKRINKIILRLKDTLGIKIGPDEANLADVPFRTVSDLMDSPPPLFTGDYQFEYPGSYEKTGQFLIQQDQPLPMTLQAIYLQMEITG